MEENADPALEALRRAASVQDSDLNTAEFRAAFAAMVPPARRPPVARLALVAASAAAVVGFGWQAFAPVVDRVGAGDVDSPDMALVAAQFDAVAADFPLPEGQTYDALRSKVLAHTKDHSFTVAVGEMPANAPAPTSALVAKYAGCKWWQLESNGTFSALSPQEQRNVQEHSQRALDEVLKSLDEALKNDGEPTGPIPITKYWDATCKEVE